MSNELTILGPIGN